MKSHQEILALLNELDHVIADDLEDQFLDFKLCPTDARQMLKVIYEGVLCFANARGGTLVLGVQDKLEHPSRAEAIRGVPKNLDLNLIQRQIHDTTDPKLTPHLELLDVPEGTLLLIHVAAATPPVTSTQVPPSRRVGKQCLPLTGTMMRSLLEQHHPSDWSAQTVHGAPALELVSAAEMERLRDMARRNNAPADLIAQPDQALLTSIGVIRNTELTLAGVLLVGKREAVRQYVPNHEWSYAKMRHDTDIELPDKGSEPILGALERLETLIRASNPITTVQQGMGGFIHTEFRTYPEIALREALLNAFVHRDYTIAGPILVQQHPARLEIKNLGGLMGGIRPENILNHPPAHRNRTLADALESIGLVNRKNLGVKRIFQSLLREGKEPPVYTAHPQAVQVTFHAHKLDEGFLRLVNWVHERFHNASRVLNAHELLVLHFMKRHREVSNPEITQAMQLEADDARETLTTLETLGVIEHGGSGRGVFYRFTRTAMDELGDSIGYDRDRRLEWEAIKTRVLSVLQDRPLTNAEIRAICDLDRNKVFQLMRELRQENLVRSTGKGRFAQWLLTNI
jgi:ATP-dependent DNA helicase RecG